MKISACVLFAALAAAAVQAGLAQPAFALSERLCAAPGAPCRIGRSGVLDAATSERLKFGARCEGCPGRAVAHCVGEASKKAAKK